MKYGHRDVTSCCGRRPQRAMEVLQSFAMTCLLHVQVLVLPKEEEEEEKKEEAALTQ